MNCKLCKINDADKPNSHIIPKFLSKRLFEYTKPRYTIAIKKSGKSRKIQDTPKENNILCENCEKRLEHIETLISRKITSINNYSNLKDDFNVVKFASNKILECLNLNPFAFKLFINSIVWRISISSLPEFELFKLPDDVESELRLFLNQNLYSSHKELIISFEKPSVYPNYHFNVFKPIVRNQFSRGILSAYQIGQHQYGIFTTDFIIFFYSDNNYADPILKAVSNNHDRNVRIVLAEIEDWKELSLSVVYKMLKKQ